VPTKTSSNGRQASAGPREITSSDLVAMVGPLSRKLVWAIGSTYFDQIGYRLPNKKLAGLADQLAIDALDALKLLTIPAFPVPTEPPTKPQQ